MGFSSTEFWHTTGSRRITRLNKDIRRYLDDIIKKGPTVLIGDANGSDKALQQYLAGKKYRQVVVFCAGTSCRNNVDNWEVRFVQSNRTSKDFTFYAAKDLEMWTEADYGLMLWDGKSKGTLNSILSLIENGKKVMVYFSPKRLLINLFSTQDLSYLLKNCDRASLDYFEKTLRISDRLHSQHRQLTIV